MIRFTLRQLEYVVRAAETGSVTLAAKRVRASRRHGRLRSPHPLGRQRHAARITRRDEVLELAQGEPHPRIIVVAGHAVARRARGSSARCT